MKAAKYKHLRLEDRISIETYLDCGISITGIAKRIQKDRTTLARRSNAPDTISEAASNHAHRLIKAHTFAMAAKRRQVVACISLFTPDQSQTTNI